MEATKRLSEQTRPKPSSEADAELTPFIVRFAQNVERDPDHVAIVDGERTISYGELNVAANRLAHKILNSRGEREEPVVFLSGLEADSIIAILGIWKAAKFYVALDPANPIERLNSILESTEAALIVTNGANLALARELSQERIEVINIDELDEDLPSQTPSVSIELDTLGMVSFTSGSTGQPKGVMTTQRSLASRATKSTSYSDYGANDRILLPFNPSFAWALDRVRLALLPGGTLYLLDYNSMTLREIASWLIKNKITSMAMTGTMFTQFLASIPKGLPKFPDVRVVNVGGEAFNHQDLELWKKHFSPHCILSTSFASSEAGVLTRVNYTFESQITGQQFGKPEPGVKIFILDDGGLSLKSGEVGRIAVRSKNLTSGYWRRPDLNKGLFVPDPENPQEKVLVTNDLGRLHADGSLEFMGRWDAMLKIRGYRVEPGEIESALRRHPAIQNVAVAGRQSSPEQSISLVAYIVLKPEQPVAAKDLREFLSSQVPHYMVPAYYIFLDELPRTSSGKIDRQALPDPDWSTSEALDYQAPLTELEKSLADLWAKILGKDHIGVTDDFFMLGGHSLAAFRITTQIQESTGLKLPLQVLITYPTIRALANVIEARTQEAVTPSSLTTIRQSSGGPSLFFVPGVARTSIGLHKLAERMDATLGVYGLEYPGMDGYLEPIDNTEKLAAFFADQILAVQPQGPYSLAGQYHGGVTAFEIARQLSARGHKVDLVVLLDSSPPGMRDDELDGRESTYYLKRLLVMLGKENRANLIPFVVSRVRRTSLIKAIQRPGRSQKSEGELPQLRWTENPLDQASLRVAYAARKARDTYTPQKLHARGLAIMSSMARGSARETWWRRLFDHLECHYIPGTTHANIFSAEHSRKMTGELISKAILHQSK